MNIQRVTGTIRMVVSTSSIALLCLAYAARGAEYSTSASLPEDSLVKPPPRDWSPFLPKAEAVARGKYPELFAGRFAGTTEVLVDLSIDGTVLDLNTIQYLPGPIDEHSLPKKQRDQMFDSTVHDAYLKPGAQGSKFIGWFGSKHMNGLYLYYRVVKWPIDESRSVAKVQAAVAARYPQFYTPHPLQIASNDSPIALLTVVMNNDGTIDRSKFIDAADQGDLIEMKGIARFRELEITPQQLAHRGSTFNRGDLNDKNQSAPLLRIEYAWHRRNDDPMDEVLQPLDVFKKVFLLQQKEQQEQLPDDVFVKHYFPDVWRDGLQPSTRSLWMFLNQEGQVLYTGISTENDIRSIDDQFKKKHPGIKTSGLRAVGVKTQNGSTVLLTYFWLAADSPFDPKASTKLKGH